jgi:hypothetical protein
MSEWSLVVRPAVLLLLGVAAASPLFPQHPDPLFAEIPFNQWFDRPEQTGMRWTARVSRPRLSTHQRLSAELEVSLDGVELAKRRGKGQLFVLAQLNDAKGQAFQDHGTIELDKIEEGVSKQDVTCTLTAFILPGDYGVSLALFFTSTGEHSVKREKLHVPPLKNDPLPEAWRDLPAVEFIEDGEPPDSWYLPSVTGRLHLPLEARRPARIDVIVNLTPSEKASGSERIQGRNLGALLPALKAIAAVDRRNASLNVALLDLSRQRVLFHQDDVSALDWSGMRDALTGQDPGKIDLKSLENRGHDAAFFVTEVRRRLGAGPEEQARALVVLSSPVAFERGEDLEPIRLTSAPDCRVFYFRCRPQTILQPPQEEPARGRRPGFVRPIRFGPGPQIDQLEPTLKPLAPRLFDIETPEQFRKALAAVLSEISSM